MISQPGDFLFYFGTLRRNINCYLSSSQMLCPCLLLAAMGVSLLCGLPSLFVYITCTDASTSCDVGFTHVFLRYVRQYRWDKPDEHIAQAVESRMRDIDQAAERSLRVIFLYIYKHHTFAVLSYCMYTRRSLCCHALVIYSAPGCRINCMNIFIFELLFWLVVRPFQES